MNRALVLLAVATACSSSAERARESAEFRQGRDSLLSTDVVKALQQSESINRLIYGRPADLSYDSLLVTRPELAAAGDRRPR